MVEWPTDGTQWLLCRSHTSHIAQRLHALLTRQTPHSTVTVRPHPLFPCCCADGCCGDLMAGNAAVLGFIVGWVMGKLVHADEQVPPGEG